MASSANRQMATVPRHIRVVDLALITTLQLHGDRRTGLSALTVSLPLTGQPDRPEGRNFEFLYGPETAEKLRRALDVGLAEDSCSRIQVSNVAGKGGDSHRGDNRRPLITVLPWGPISA